MVKKDDMKKAFSDRLNAACVDAGVAGRGLAGRIKECLKKQGISVTEAAIWKWLNAAAIPEKTNIIAISKWLNVRPEWLEYGGSNAQVDNSNNQQSSIPPLREWGDVEAWDSTTPLMDDEVEIPFYKSIELAAGHGCSTNMDYNGYKLRFSKATLRKAGAQPECVFAFSVHGNSMDPVIPNGSTVTVDTANKRIVDGGIYAIEQDELFRVKLLYRQPGHNVILRSYNRIDYQDEEVSVDSVKIIGRVIHYSVMLL
ncbi:LexA family transcriptional regulator [Edwardsiella piscicida]|uniref:LexA family transcriptional regulator n=1 Tax=Edwardsiella piscicida TaxID=1263550 RepID=UPI0009330A4A|nr:helix-turn-helix transcriptional regulator [Edwardsiella piscicida]